MKGAISTLFRILVISLIPLLVPATILAESPQTSKGLPPVAQILIREGTLATQLAGALNSDAVKNDEAEAESWLGDKGISPKNGWIADYPVTPVIMGELQESLGSSAESHNIALSRDDALKLLDNITRELAIVNRSPGDSGSGNAAPEGETLVAPAAVNDYYTEVGPPVVTYYAPPYDYYYLYSWVPYPFWCGGFAFGGFFILNDFHRALFIDRFHNRGLHNRAFVSNHFRDRFSNRVIRVEPGFRSGVRFSGNTGAFARQSPLMSGAQGRTSRPSINSQRTQLPPAAMRARSLNSASLQGMRSRTEGVAFARQTGDTNVSRSFSSTARSSVPVSSSSSFGRNFESGRSFSTSVRSFGSANSSMSSFRSGGGGFGGGFSRGGGGFSGGHGRR